MKMVKSAFLFVMKTTIAPQLISIKQSFTQFAFTYLSNNITDSASSLISD